MKKHYYIPYDPKAGINYLYLLALYEIADFNTETKCFDTIIYSSVSKLADNIGLSNSTLYRILNDEKYNAYFTVDKENKIIRLKNDFKNGTITPFVCLSSREVELIRQRKDNLFSSYLVYLKYYCGFAAGKQDFTARQFLAACGYSTKSNEMISRISEYNRDLTAAGILKITKYRDSLGHERNAYSII